MQIRALKTFNSKQHGLVREGMVITVDDRYGNKLIAGMRPLAAVMPLEPERNASLPGPDKVKDSEGNEERDDATAGSSRRRGGRRTSSEPAPASGETDNSSEAQPEGGQGRRSSSRRQGRRSIKLK